MALCSLSFVHLCSSLLFPLPVLPSNQELHLLSIVLSSFTPSLSASWHSSHWELNFCPNKHISKHFPLHQVSSVGGISMLVVKAILLAHYKFAWSSQGDKRRHNGCWGWRRQTMRKISLRADVYIQQINMCPSCSLPSWLLSPGLSRPTWLGKIYKPQEGHCQHSSPYHVLLSCL